MEILLWLVKHWRLAVSLAGVLLIAVSLSFGAGYFRGYGTAKTACKTKALEAKVRSLEDSLDLAQRVQEKAALRAVARDRQHKEMADKVADYEQKLDEDPECVLTDDDVISMP